MPTNGFFIIQGPVSLPQNQKPSPQNRDFNIAGGQEQIRSASSNIITPSSEFSTAESIEGWYGIEKLFGK